tara:strand:+ start:876 stop:1310 length:435 start_codon:yes stop_codon:yes gene_type:complete
MKHTLICVTILSLLLGCTHLNTSPQDTTKVAPEKTIEKIEIIEQKQPKENKIGWPTQYVYQETTVCLQGTRQRGMPPQIAFSVCCCIFDNLQKKYTLGEFYTRKLEPDYQAEIVSIVQNQCSSPAEEQKQQIHEEYNTQYWIKK